VNEWEVLKASVDGVSVALGVAGFPYLSVD
jgi:hypothetical protein